MKIVQKPKYYYHVTEKKWPQQITLKPISGEKCYNRPEEEPDLARTCVSDKISGCLCAIYPTITTYVYRTKHKVKAVYPWRVPDSKITRERWLVKPIKFIRHCVLKGNIMDEILDETNQISCGDDDPEELETQRQAMENIDKILLKHKILEKE